MQKKTETYVVMQLIYDSVPEIIHGALHKKIAHKKRSEVEANLETHDNEWI
jgi:calcineurin-like phosphoesterase family protein